jgi:flavin reductase (DIM6/NTAB) family NADH-FMN oxidoreductase RutF
MDYSAAHSLEVNASFRHIMSLSPTPVTIVTATTSDGPQGIVIGSFVSVSLEPALIGFFVGKWTRMWAPMSQAAAYCVNVLADGQADLSERFTRHDIDRFAGVDWEPAEDGSPALSGAVAWISTKPYSVTDAGDHDLILMEVTGLREGEMAGPLVYHRGQYSGVARRH